MKKDGENNPEGTRSTRTREEANFVHRRDLQKGLRREFEGRETVTRFEEAQN